MNTEVAVLAAKGVQFESGIMGTSHGKIIDDTDVAQTLTKTITGKFLQIKVGPDDFFIPLYS